MFSLRRQSHLCCKASACHPANGWDCDQAFSGVSRKEILKRAEHPCMIWMARKRDNRERHRLADKFFACKLLRAGDFGPPHFACGEKLIQLLMHAVASTHIISVGSVIDEELFKGRRLRTLFSAAASGDEGDPSSGFENTTEFLQGAGSIEPMKG